MHAHSDATTIGGSHLDNLSKACVIARDDRTAGASEDFVDAKLALLIDQRRVLRRRRESASFPQTVLLEIPPRSGQAITVNRCRKGATGVRGPTKLPRRVKLVITLVISNPAMQSWPVQDAKARFSEFLDKCLSEGPQLVTRRGAEAAVLVPAEEWRRLQLLARPSLKALLLSGEAKAELTLPARGQARRRPVSAG